MILEVQRRIDERKRLTWFDYLASARRRGPACVVVITTSTRVAAWAVQPLSLGRIVTATSARAVFAPPRPRTPRSS